MAAPTATTRARARNALRSRMQARPSGERRGDVLRTGCRIGRWPRGLLDRPSPRDHGFMDFPQIWRHLNNSSRVVADAAQRGASPRRISSQRSTASQAASRALSGAVVPPLRATRTLRRGGRLDRERRQRRRELIKRQPFHGRRAATAASARSASHPFSEGGRGASSAAYRPPDKGMARAGCPT